MPIDTLLPEVQALCDALLVRALDVVEVEFPQLHAAVFSDHGHVSKCAENPMLTYAVGEPGINIYTNGGQFQPHEDRQSLTILVNLSDDSTLSPLCPSTRVFSSSKILSK